MGAPAATPPFGVLGATPAFEPAPAAAADPLVPLGGGLRAATCVCVRRDPQATPSKDNMPNNARTRFLTTAFPSWQCV